MMKIASILLLLISGCAYYFSLGDALIHPIALEFGRPTQAIVSGKRVSHGRDPGKYLSLNYKYSADYAQRPEVRVNDRAYAAIGIAAEVAIHYIPGCPSCVALDGDYGSAAEQGLEFACFLVVIIVLSFFHSKSGRMKNRKKEAAPQAEA